MADLTLNQPQEIYQLNMNHQEIERILKEVEDNCDVSHHTLWVSIGSA